MPPPANDNFVNATILTGSGGTITGTTVEATFETGEEAWHGGIDGSVWYKLPDLHLGGGIFTLHPVAAGMTSPYIILADAPYGSEPTNFVDTLDFFDYTNDSTSAPPDILYDLDNWGLLPEGKTWWICVTSWPGGAGTFQFDWTVVPYEKIYHDTVPNDIESWSRIGSNIKKFTSDWNNTGRAFHYSSPVSSICIGPGGLKYVAWIELQGSITGSVIHRMGPWVHFWEDNTIDPDHWTNCDGPGPNGEVNDTTPADAGLPNFEVVNAADIGTANPPQVCSDGTYVYICYLDVASFLGTSTTLGVWRWDGATWTKTSIADVAGFVLLRASTDLDGCIVTYKGTDNRQYVSHVSSSGTVTKYGGAEVFSLTGPNYGDVLADIVIDSNGYPHGIRYPLNIAGPQMWSWTGSAWVSTNLTNIELGLNEDYGTTYPTSIDINPSRVAGRAMSEMHGTGRNLSQVAIRVYRNAPISPNPPADPLDPGAYGYGIYIFEWNTTTRRVQFFNGNKYDGRVISEALPEPFGINAYWAFSMMTPEDTRNLSWGTIHEANFSFGSTTPIAVVTYDTFCDRWVIRANASAIFHADPFGGSTNRVELGDETITESILRDGEDFFYFAEQYNGRSAVSFYVQAEHATATATGSRIADAGAMGGYYWNDTQALDGSALNGSELFPTALNVTFGGNTVLSSNDNAVATIEARVRVNGGGGNGDVVAYDQSSGGGTITPLGYGRQAADGAWHTITVLASYQKASGRRYGFKVGVNGGATSIDIDWVRFHYPNGLVYFELYKTSIVRNGGYCFEPIVTGGSIIWFYKDGAWHMADNNAPYNVWFYKNGQWRPSVVDPEYDTYGQFNSTWQR